MSRILSSWLLARSTSESFPNVSVDLSIAQFQHVFVLPKLKKNRKKSLTIAQKTAESVRKNVVITQE